MHLFRRLYALGVVVGVIFVISGVEVLGRLQNDQSEHSIALFVAGVFGAVACATPAWRVLRYLVTLIHEIGHAVCACLLGGKVRRIVINPDSSGLATYALPLGWGFIRAPIAAGGGYLAPSIAGITCAVAAVRGVVDIWLWCCVGYMAGALVLLIRNLWGAWLTVLFGTLIALVARFGEGLEVLGVGILGALSGILLAGAVKTAAVQITTKDIRESDAAAIGKVLHLPARFIAWIQLISCALAACYGASLLAGIV